MKCLVVGHLVIDRIVKGQEVEIRIGGGAYYSALALSKFCEVKVLTSVGRDFPREWLDELERAGISLRVLPSQLSTSYELRYLDGNRRELRLLSRAGNIEDIEIESGEFDLVLLNPVAGEVSPHTVSKLISTKIPVSVDVQGFIRVPEIGPLRLRKIDASFLKGAKVLHSDEAEFRYLSGFSPSDVEVLLLSRGLEPGTAYLRGRSYRYYPLKVDVSESTGAGDVFLASFTYFYLRCLFVQALKRANAFTSLFLKKKRFDLSMEEICEGARGVKVERLTTGSQENEN